MKGRQGRREGGGKEGEGEGEGEGGGRAHLQPRLKWKRRTEVGGGATRHPLPRAHHQSRRSAKTQGADLGAFDVKMQIFWRRKTPKRR